MDIHWFRTLRVCLIPFYFSVTRLRCFRRILIACVQFSFWDCEILNERCECCCMPCISLLRCCISPLLASNRIVSHFPLTIRLTFLFHFGCSFWFSRRLRLPSINPKLKFLQTNEQSRRLCRISFEYGVKSFIRLSGLCLDGFPKCFFFAFIYSLWPHFVKHFDATTHLILFFCDEKKPVQNERRLKKNFSIYSNFQWFFFISELHIALKMSTNQKNESICIWKI